MPVSRTAGVSTAPPWSSSCYLCYGSTILCIILHQVANVNILLKNKGQRTKNKESKTANAGFGNLCSRFSKNRTYVVGLQIRLVLPQRLLSSGQTCRLNTHRVSRVKKNNVRNSNEQAYCVMGMRWRFCSRLLCSLFFVLYMVPGSQFFILRSAPVPPLPWRVRPSAGFRAGSARSPRAAVARPTP